MPVVLRDDRIDHTLQKQLARHDSHVMPDENYLLFAPGFDERLGNAGRSGANIIEAGNVRMIAQQPHHEVF